MLNIMNSHIVIKMCNRLIMLILVAVSIWSCQKIEEEYLYEDTEKFVDIDIMSLIQDEPAYSIFSNLLLDFNIDTLYQKGKTLTMFIPTNAAFENVSDVDTVDLLNYLIVESYVNVASVNNFQKVKTLGGKFIELSRLGGQNFINKVLISKAGPLCNNGRYYVIDSIVRPLPNLYEYIEETNPFFKKYIDSRDSSYLNLELSKPIGYNEKGMTVYDSVIDVVNLFVEEYFPVNSEFKNKRATMLLFDEMQFNTALSVIAADIGLPSKDNIPDQWKNDVLMPYLINQGMFWNEIEYAEFMIGRIRNIKGDSVHVDYKNIDPGSEFQCSNGRVFNYLDFLIPDSLYKGSVRIQGEDLVILKGFDLYSWAPDVVVSGASVDPKALMANDLADNDSLLVVNFEGDDYNEEFELSFIFKNIFPGKYRLVWRGKSTPSGMFEIYVNGVRQTIDLGRGGKDYVDLYDLRNPVRSITKTEVFRPTKGFNKFDVLIENITNYGDVEVKIKYQGPGQRSDNGFIIDYVDLVSYSE